MRLTSVGVGGAHHNHRGANASCLPKAQTVVLLLGKHRQLVVGIIHIYDHLQGMIFEAVHQLYILALRNAVFGKVLGHFYEFIMKSEINIIQILAAWKGLDPLKSTFLDCIHHKKGCHFAFKCIFYLLIYN